MVEICYLDGRWKGKTAFATEGLTDCWVRDNATRCPHFNLNPDIGGIWYADKDRNGTYNRIQCARCAAKSGLIW